MKPSTIEKEKRVMKGKIHVLILLLIGLFALGTRCLTFHTGPLPSGVWGALHWEMIVYDDGTAFIEGDCSHGDVLEPIEAVEGEVAFELDLVSEIMVPDPPVYPAFFEGRLIGRTLKGTLTINGVSTPFEVRLGEDGRLYKCL